MRLVMPSSLCFSLSFSASSSHQFSSSRMKLLFPFDSPWLRRRLAPGKLKLGSLLTQIFPVYQKHQDLYFHLPSLCDSTIPSIASLFPMSCLQARVNHGEAMLAADNTRIRDMDLSRRYFNGKSLLCLSCSLNPMMFSHRNNPPWIARRELWRFRSISIFRRDSGNAQGNAGAALHNLTWCLPIRVSTCVRSSNELLWTLTSLRYLANELGAIWT